MSELLSSLSSLFTLLFAVGTMFSMGLRLTVGEILEPLGNLRLLLVTLGVNFVVVPLAALVLASIFLTDPDLRTGLLVISAVAGAPLVPKLAEIAGGSARLAVGLVVLLLVGTVVYAPLALPLLLPGLQVDPVGIATPLSLQMLLPLALGLFVAARYEEEAEWMQPVVAQIANISLALLIVVTLVLNVGDVFGLFGSGAVAATLLLFAVALAAGYFLGGRDPRTRRVVSLATGQRNLAAAFVIATGNFADRPNVLILLAAAGLLGMLVIFPLAGEFGRRSRVAVAAGSGGRTLAERGRAGRP